MYSLFAQTREEVRRFSAQERKVASAVARLTWRERSLMSAGVLTALTLLVFSLSQFSGPRSALSRFHEALAEPDVEEVLSVVEEPLGDPHVTLLASRAAQLTDGAKTLAYREVGREGRLAVFDAIYVRADGPYALRFVLSKGDDERWRILARPSVRSWRSL